VGDSVLDYVIARGVSINGLTTARRRISWPAIVSGLTCSACN